MEIVTDALYWSSSSGVLSPRTTPADMNYPGETDVITGTVYGYESQYTGDYGGGTEATPAVLSEYLEFDTIHWVLTGDTLSPRPAALPMLYPVESLVRSGIRYGDEDQYLGQYGAASALVTDALYWSSSSGVLSPRTTPADMNYPGETDVITGTVYGYESQYTGDYGGGTEATPAVLSEFLEFDIIHWVLTGDMLSPRPAALPMLYPAVSLVRAGIWYGDENQYLGRYGAAPEYQRSTFGDEFLAMVCDEMLDAFGKPITYYRGAEMVDLTAIQGDAIYANDTDTGIDVPLGDATFDVPADSLSFGAGPLLPRPQDQIVTARGTVYVVIGEGTLDCEQICWTIPVKRSYYLEVEN